MISITVFHDPSEFYHGEVIGEVLYAALLEAAETPDEQLKGAPTE